MMFELFELVFELEEGFEEIALLVLFLFLQALIPLDVRVEDRPK